MKHLCTAAIFAFAMTTAQAGQPIADHKESKQMVVTTPFDQGKHEFQLGVGYNWSLNTDSDLRPTINDLDLHLRYGWMLTSPAGEGAFRGNWELLAELFGAGITEGPGDYIVGLTALLRYNFVQPDAKLVPYFQIGVGGVYTDISDEPVQRLIGQEFEFNLQAGLGLRYLLSDSMAVYVEGTFRHLSNADMAERNFGLNSLGAQVGVSWFF